MKQVHILLALLILPLLLAACAGGDKSVPDAPEGPALIMFYTDN